MHCIITLNIEACDFRIKVKIDINNKFSLVPFLVQEKTLIERIKRLQIYPNEVTNLPFYTPKALHFSVVKHSSLLKIIRIYHL